CAIGFNAARLLALPSSVLGPVEAPPCNRQRLLPRIGYLMQGSPLRVFAPQMGRPVSGWTNCPHSFICKPNSSIVFRCVLLQGIRCGTILGVTFLGSLVPA